MTYFLRVVTRNGLEILSPPLKSMISWLFRRGARGEGLDQNGLAFLNITWFRRCFLSFFLAGFYHGEGGSMWGYLIGCRSLTGDEVAC